MLTPNHLLGVLHLDNKNKMTTVFYKRQKGYIALMSVILIGVFGIAIMVSVIAQGVTSSKTDFSLQQSGQARILATACAEEALQVILETATTTKTDTITLGTGTCSYSISKATSSTITVINASGNFGNLTKRVQLTLSTTTPSIVLSSWQDVSDF